MSERPGTGRVMDTGPHRIDAPDAWLEDVGEVELIGGWAEVILAADFVANADTSCYQVFATSYAAVPVFVSNRHATGFEIHAVPTSRPGPSRARCAWRVIGRRRTARPAREDPS